MSFSIAQTFKIGLAAAIVAGSVAGVAIPAQAGDGGAIAAGVLGGAALGALAGSAAAGAYAPRYYAPPPPPPAYVVPAEAPPLRCHREFIRSWDPYAGVYVDRPRRVCDAY